MTGSNNDGVRSGFAAVLAAAMMSAVLSGCSAEQDFSPTFYAHELPSVTEYSSDAEEMRKESETDSLSHEDIREETEKETSVILTETKSDTEEVTEESTETSRTPESSSVSETITVTEAPVTESSLSETTTAVQTTVTVKPETSALTMPAAPEDYDKEFFSEDLFIGDSISTGYSLYGFLKEKNVYAKVGLNPSTVLTKTVSTVYGDIGVADMIAYTQPKRVYIMLGSNGIQWLSVGNMLQSTNTLITLIHDTYPEAEPVIISVPPVTTGYDSTVPDVDVMAKINEYNTSLSSYCNANDILFVDAASVLKDETGYFNKTYAEKDGMHFKSSAYKTLLSKIQTDVMEFEAELSEEESPSETEASDAEAIVTEASVTEAIVSETEAAVETEKVTETVKVAETKTEPVTTSATTFVIPEPVITDTVKINKKPAATTAKKPKSEPVVILDVQD